MDARENSEIEVYQDWNAATLNIKCLVPRSWPGELSSILPQAPNPQNDWWLYTYDRVKVDGPLIPSTDENVFLLGGG